MIAYVFTPRTLWLILGLCGLLIFYSALQVSIHALFQTPASETAADGSANADELAYIRFLDVGHGQAILVQADGQNMLVDGGDVWAGDKLMGHLKRFKVERLDALFLSRPEAKFIGALPSILPAIGVAKVYDGTPVNKVSASVSLLKQLEYIGAPYHQLRAGERLALTPRVQAFVLTPLAGLEGEGIDYSSAEEGLSMVLQIDQLRILLAGSMFHDDEDALVRLYGRSEYQTPQLHAQVLHVPRHGAHNAATAALLQAVRPEVAVIQVGAYNEQSLPDLRLLDRLQKAGISVYRTDRYGNVSIWTDGRSWGIETEYRRGLN